MKDSLYYSIYDIEGKKVVCIHGFFDSQYREIQYKGAYIPLDEFPWIGRKVLNEFLLTLETIQKPLGGEKAIDIAEHYYAGKKAAKLPFREVDVNTPCGDYVDDERDAKEGDMFYITGNIRLGEHVAKRGTTGTVLMSKPYNGRLLCQLDELDGERNITVYCDRDMIQIA
ncbi:MAG: hypothetical protein J6I68_00510 [Butyrivibrio sp.]|uniref:hypothetical protein n=1 Tax=Butyrivibrio sp. TaxID=28121 RepID=UPI001B5338E0|nr:hypothetical protein [Butyrivibrio sp.]MBP3781709.1 hypothetical protein [Butyrivibrio sp.]